MVSLLALSLLAASALATPLENARADLAVRAITAPEGVTIPVGQRDTIGLDAIAQGSKRYFGVAFDVNRMSDVAYTAIILSQFGQITAENSLKWETTEPTQGVFNFTNGDIVVATAQKNSQSFRAHVLVWHSQLPAWVVGGAFNKTSLISVINDHIKAVAGHYKGAVYTWDVVNEVFNENGTFRSTVFYDTIGEEFIDISFKTAREVDSKAQLAINDYNIDGTGPKSDAMAAYVKAAKARGVPIDQIGAQAHLVVGTLPTTMQQNWQAFADLGVNVAVTELDIRMPTPVTQANLLQQAKDYDAVVSACFNVVRCVGVTVWGASDKYSWVPEYFDGEGAPLPYDEDLKPKPAYNASIEAMIMW